MVTRRSDPPTPEDRHDALSMTSKTHDVLDVHRASGRRFEAGGVASFVREQGSERSSPVVLLHGVPTSSFLYRKVLPGLADQGLRGIAFDYPGLGLADRPDEFDYTWSGLARWTGDAIDALGVFRCHLVVHDIGGPIGCEWAVRNPERVLSLTVLNTMLDPATFRRPWSMHPFSVPVLGRLWLWSLRPWLFERLFYMQGIGNRAAVSRHEVRAYYEARPEQYKELGVTLARARAQIRRNLADTKRNATMARWVRDMNGYYAGKVEYGPGFGPA